MTSRAPRSSVPAIAHGTHHPAEVGEPEQGVAPRQVERVGEVLRGLDREAAVDVDGTLRPPGRSRGVDDHVRRLGVALRRLVGLTCLVGFGGRVAPAHVATVGPRHVDGVARTTHDDHPLDGRRRGKRRVRDRLQVDPGAASEEAVDRYQELRFAVGKARCDRRRTVSGEDRREDRPDPADGEHRDHRLRKHRQQDPDPVALADAELSKVIGRTMDCHRQLAIRQLDDRTVLTLPRHRDATRVALGARLDRGPRPVERAADPPASPRRPTAQIGDLAWSASPGDRDVVRGGTPEPRWIGRGSRLQRFQRRLSRRPQKTGQARLCGRVGIGTPGDVVAVAAEDRPVIWAR